MTPRREGGYPRRLGGSGVLLAALLLLACAGGVAAGQSWGAVPTPPLPTYPCPKTRLPNTTGCAAPRHHARRGTRTPCSACMARAAAGPPRPRASATPAARRRLPAPTFNQVTCMHAPHSTPSQVQSDLCQPQRQRHRRQRHHGAAVHDAPGRVGRCRNTRRSSRASASFSQR